MREIGIAKTHKGLRRIATVVLGLILILGGIVGLFLPVVPGVFLIVVGGLMLNPRCARLRRVLMSSEVSYSNAHGWGAVVLYSVK
jgi:uncharacterized membrane protein YbaN (DUF454 family)